MAAGHRRKEEFNSMDNKQKAKMQLHIANCQVANFNNGCIINF